MGHRLLTSALIAPVASLVMFGPVAAQPNPNRDIKIMNFDLWCQEQAAFPPARCDKRTPQDEIAFEAYRASLERYEVPYSSAEYDQARVNRDIMNNDPIDNPHNDEMGAQRQYPNSPVLEVQ